ncbi:DUF424 family protein [archaeon]|jgi:hypothetical protein|nr:DUF424 family protein [archaeon]MBT4272111.1 DUF424 family protein [archaeon]MBT4461732.1 DUF424 family protein [archaeon]MBT4858814.1 DUF424 family protein [archaeon]MBT5423091.1 DUF424 family protein [archaeon]
MIVNKKYNDGRLFLSICDDNLIGKKFSDKNMILDLKKEYFSGEKTTESELSELIKKAYFISCVGINSIKILEKFKDIERKKVENIPYSFILR